MESATASIANLYILFEAISDKIDIFAETDLKMEKTDFQLPLI